MSPDLRNQVRGIVEEGEGRNQVYRGEVASIEDAYMFVDCSISRKTFLCIERVQVTTNGLYSLVGGRCSSHWGSRTARSDGCLDQPRGLESP